MAITIGELRGIISLQDQFSGPANNVAKQLGFMGESFGAVTKFTGLVAAGVTAVGGAIVALGVHGSKVESMESSFNALARSIGLSGDAMLEATRSATKGLINDMDLMAASNKAMLLGLPVTVESMAGMAKAATVLGRAMGQDAKKSLDDMTTALGRSSPLILDNLGLTVRVGDANEAYARKLGRSSASLSDAEKKMAFYEASMEAARKKVAELGDVQLTFGDRVQQGRVAVENFVADLGKAIATSPAVAAGLDSIMTSIQGAFGGDQQATVKALMGFVASFAIGVTYAGQIGLTAATVFVTAWAAIKTAILGVMTVISLVGTGLVSLVAGIGQLATAIPGAGKFVEGFATGATNLALAMDDVTHGLQAEMVEAAKAVVGNSELHRTLVGMQGTLINAREAMEKANTETNNMAAANEAVKTKLEETDTAVTLTAEQIRAMADATFRAQEVMSDASIEIATKFTELQEQLTLANTEGLAKRLLEIDLAMQKEAAGIQHIALLYPEEYEAAFERLKELYGLKTAAAVEAFTMEAEAAVDSNKTQQQQAEETIAKAKANYRELLAAGKATFEQLRRAHEAVNQAEQNLDEIKTQEALKRFDTIASSASSILRSLFSKNKAAAIAAVLIDAAAAIVKAFAQGGFFGFAMAATVAAATAAQIAKIKNAKPEGFSHGTPKTEFMDFGRGALHMLHGEEAVVTRRQGESLADMVLEAAGGRGQELHVHLDLDGREITKKVIRLMPRELAHAGVR